MRKQKGFLNIVAIIAIVVVGLGVVGIGVFRSIEKNMDELVELPIIDIDFSSLIAGTYQGEFSSFPVAAEVEVTVEGERVTGINLINHRHGPGYGAEEILGRVIEAQSLKVDVISGATYSSVIVLKAIEEALNDAVQ